ncbi:MAG: GspE/PulE family protein [Isosphaeraceae bacterium]
MSEPLVSTLQSDLDRLDRRDPQYPTSVVDRILARAAELGVSDVHLQPTPDGLDVRWRIDGVLAPAARLSVEVAPRIIARLKVLADLLTYRTELPQEGRIRGVPGSVEMRLSTLPTLHGEKAVVRMFAGAGRYLGLADLGLPGDILSVIERRLTATSGALVFAGPAGSGKTTTLYASLRAIAAASLGRRSLTTLEDPIEIAVPGVAQSQVNPHVGFTMEIGLRALLRQDPEVIAVGEIRDKGTAEVAFQASLTGHLVLSTFHAGSTAAVVGRLSDMEIEPYLLRSGLLAVVAQRLVRRLCSCSRETDDAGLALGLELASFRVPVGCELCGGSGYRGRLLLAELFLPDAPTVGRAILDRVDVGRLESIACEAGMIPLRQRAREAVATGQTDPAEIRRVLGAGD